jgi:RNA polymerase sigma-70 factor (ECF subfamily)
MLLLSIQGGDSAALGALFDVHGAAVRRLIRNSGVPASDVDDLVQLTFLDVPHAARRFDHRFPVRRWLLGIAGIIVARHRRAAGRHAARHAAWAVDPAFQPAQGDACRELEWKRGAERAFSALQRLPSKKREVFELVVLDDISGEEAARSLGVPVSTVWTRLHYARRELRRLLTLPRCAREGRERRHDPRSDTRGPALLEGLG